MPKVETFDRDQVIQSAVVTFHNKGYNLTSMQDLVDATGLNRSSIYNSFGSKLDLYMECLRSYQQISRRELQKTIISSKSPFTTIQNIFCMNINAAIKDSKDNGCFINQCTTEMANQEQRIQYFLNENQASMIELFEDIVMQGQSDGGINKKKTPKEYAMYLVSSLQGLRISGILMNDKQQLELELSDKVNEIKEVISDVIVGYEDGYSIEKRVGDLLSSQLKTICTAESLTGGKIAATMVSVSGASSYFKGSFVTYSAEAKQQMLGVSEATIKNHTVVSKEVASEMAIAARKKLQTDYAIAVTGNAGPTTDKTDKSVGDVFIAIASEDTVFVEEFNFGQPREKVINRTVNKSLEILQKELLKNN